MSSLLNSSAKVPYTAKRSKQVTPADGPPQRRYLVLIIGMVLFVELNAMVIQMVVPALHYMAPKFPVDGLAWVLTVVTVIGAMVLPLGGKLADQLGLRQIILAVAVLFGVGSVICALTDSFALFLVGRALQAVVLATTAVAYRVYRDVLPARYVPVALGSIGAGIGVAGLIGPVIAGALLDAWGYQSLFWFFAAYIAVVAPIVYFSTPKSAGGTLRGVDFSGGLTLAVGLGGVLLGLSQAMTTGWTSPGTIAPVVVGLVAFGLFPLVERRQREPMIELSLLARPAVLMTLLVAFFGQLPVIGFAFALPQMLQTAKDAGLGYGFGLTALAVGLVQIPYGLFGTVFGPLGGAVTRKLPVRTVMLSSLVFLTLGALLLGLFHAQLEPIVVWTALVGIGFGLFWAAQPNLMVDAVPAERTGVSGGIQLATQATATSVGSTLIGAILASNMVGVAAGQPIFSDGAFTTIFLGSAASGMIAIVLTLFMRHGRRPATGGAR